MYAYYFRYKKELFVNVSYLFYPTIKVIYSTLRSVRVRLRQVGRYLSRRSPFLACIVEVWYFAVPCYFLHYVLASFFLYSLCSGTEFVARPKRYPYHKELPEFITFAFNARW